MLRDEESNFVQSARFFDRSLTSEEREKGRVSSAAKVDYFSSTYPKMPSAAASALDDPNCKQVQGDDTMFDCVCSSAAIATSQSLHRRPVALGTCRIRRMQCSTRLISPLRDLTTFRHRISHCFEIGAVNIRPRQERAQTKDKQLK